MLPELLSRPWALQEEYLLAALNRPDYQATGFIPDTLEARTQRPSKDQRQVALIPVHGPISERPSMLSMLFGGTSLQELSASLHAAVADPKVSSVVLDIDSPGGGVYGVQELAAEVRSLRRRKPIIAVANHLMASAAYWIGSQATDVVASPSAEVGSIGVVYVHQDVSQALAQDGVRPTIIKSGKYKAEGNPLEPLSEEAHDYLQDRSDQFYGAFLESVAKGRRVSVATVRESYGQGRVLSADDALAAGMVDRVATLSQVVGAQLTPEVPEELDEEAQSRLVALWDHTLSHSRAMRGGNLSNPEEGGE